MKCHHISGKNVNTIWSTYRVLQGRKNSKFLFLDQLLQKITLQIASPPYFPFAFHKFGKNKMLLNTSLARMSMQFDIQGVANKAKDFYACCHGWLVRKKLIFHFDFTKLAKINMGKNSLNHIVTLFPMSISQILINCNKKCNAFPAGNGNI